ncbi:hypothetical protein [Streptomyces sp. URMC 123]
MPAKDERFVYDDREVPEESSRLAMRDAAQAMDAFMRPYLNRDPRDS